MLSTLFLNAIRILSLIPYIIIFVASKVYFRKAFSKEAKLILYGSGSLLLVTIAKTFFAMLILRLVSFDPHVTGWVLATFNICYIICLMIFSVGLLMISLNVAEVI